MERFTQRGMLVIPNPVREKHPGAGKSLVVCQLFCPQGHNIISPRAVFNGHPGILIEVRKGDQRGLVALSPIYGSMSRITLDIEVQKGEILDLHCPICGVKLPTHSPCNCGAEMIAFFTTPDQDYSNCIGICNRVDCINSQIIINDELISLSLLDTF